MRTAERKIVKFSSYVNSLIFSLERGTKIIRLFQIKKVLSPRTANFVNFETDFVNFETRATNFVNFESRIVNFESRPQQGSSEFFWKKVIDKQKKVVLLYSIKMSLMTQKSNRWR
jgi:hypothetical protein